MLGAKVSNLPDSTWWRNRREAVALSKPIRSGFPFFGSLSRRNRR